MVHPKRIPVDGRPCCNGRTQSGVGGGETGGQVRVGKVSEGSSRDLSMSKHTGRTAAKSVNMQYGKAGVGGEGPSSFAYPLGLWRPPLLLRILQSALSFTILKIIENHFKNRA